MLKATIILALLIVAPLAGFAQRPDTLDSSGYFPLAVGNSWEYVHLLYRFPTGDETRYERYSIVASSLVGASSQFKLVFTERNSANALLALDTLSVTFDNAASSIVGENLKGVVRFLSCLGSPYEPSDPFPSGCWPFVTEDSVRIEPLFGEAWVPSKHLQSFVWSVQVVHGIGAFRISGGCEPCGSFDDMDTWELKYANVSGERYGTIVMATQARPISRKSRGEIFPNPAHDWADVESEPFARITVYDILGRVVLQAQASQQGRTRIDLSGLRVGVYVVRVGLESETLLIR